MTHSLIAIVVKAENKEQAEQKARETLDKTLVAEHFGFFDWYLMANDKDSRYDYQIVRADTKEAEEVLSECFELGRDNQLDYLRRLREVLDRHSDSQLANFMNVDKCKLHNEPISCDNWRFYAGQLDHHASYHVFDEDGEINPTAKDLPENLSQYFVVPVDAHH